MHHPLTHYFQYKHLPEHLQVISKPLCDLAELMDKELLPHIEKDVGMRKLLEAKECFVRANL